MHFLTVGGHQQLAALFHGERVFPAECQGGGRTAFAEIGFQAAGLIINAGVNYAGIVPGLV